jgi:hypothetical protein
MALSETLYIFPIWVNGVFRIKFFNSSLEGRLVVLRLSWKHSKHLLAPQEISLPQSIQKNFLISTFFFRLKVFVWEWQLGHKNLKFSIRLSVLFPFLWSSYKTSSSPCHSPLFPHFSHLYSNKLWFKIYLFIVVVEWEEFSTKASSKQRGEAWLIFLGNSLKSIFNSWHFFFKVFKLPPDLQYPNFSKISRYDSEEFIISYNSSFEKLSILVFAIINFSFN